MVAAVSRQQLERLAVSGADGPEVATVQRDDGGRAQPLGERDHGSVGAAEREVPMLDQFRHACEVLAAESLDVELGEAVQEARFAAGPSRNPTK